jgi:hypothetical protein
VSTNGAATWTAFNGGLAPVNVRALGLGLQGGNVLYAGTEGHGVATRLAGVSLVSLNVNLIGSGVGTVTSNPSGIHCGADCSEPYSAGGRVTLVARPAFGSIFAGWSGCDATFLTHCTVTMEEGRTVRARFIALPPAILRVLERLLFQICRFD